MRRQIARWMGWWMKLFFVSVVGLRIPDWPWWITGPITLGLLGLAFVRTPSDLTAPPRWSPHRCGGGGVALNSPATKVPSHGIKAYGQIYAIDILHPSPPPRPRSGGALACAARTGSRPSVSQCSPWLMGWWSPSPPANAITAPGRRGRRLRTSWAWKGSSARSAVPASYSGTT